MSGPELILLGAGGHAKVVLDLLQANGQSVLGVCDPQLKQSGLSHWRGLAVLGDDQAVEAYEPTQVRLVNGLGGAGRTALFERYQAKGFEFATLIHPSATLGSGVDLGEGVQIMAGVILQADVVIGANSIVNTGAQIDHDSRLGAQVHVAPGAILAGDVTLGDGVFIGPGVVIGRGVNVGVGAVIGAGTTLVRSVPDQSRVLGTRWPV